MKGFAISPRSFSVLAILALALALRLWGIHFGLPYLYHADEPIVVNHALAYGMGDLNPHFFKIPPLVSELLFICYGVYYVLGRGTGFFHTLGEFERLFFSDPSSFYLIARIIFGAFLGTASVYVLYRIVKRLSGETTALWASFFLAVNFLHVRDSHYIYADIPLIFVLLLGFGVILRIAEGDRPSESIKGSVSLHLCAGVAIGLATAVKYNGVFLAIPYFWICFRTVPWKRWVPSWSLAGMTAIAIFFALNLYAILDYSFFMKEIAAQSSANSGGFPWFHHLTYSLAGAMGWPMLVLALLGAFRALWGRDLMSQAVAVFVFGYYAVLCRFGQPYDRYVLPLLPFMMILAVQCLTKLRKRSNLLFWILIPFAVLPSVLKTVHWDRLMSKPDVRTVAKDWAESGIPNGSRLALDWGFYMPRLAFSLKQLEHKRFQAQTGFQSAAKIRRIDALLSHPQQPSFELFFLSQAPGESGFLFDEPRIPFDVKTLQQEGIEYVFLVDALRPKEDPFYAELLANADRIMTFSPYRDAGDLTLHDGLTMTGGPFLWNDILPRVRGGYPVSVYRIRS